jgi:hypothetical protein
VVVTYYIEDLNTRTKMRQQMQDMEQYHHQAHRGQLDNNNNNNNNNRADPKNHCFFSSTSSSSSTRSVQNANGKRVTTTEHTQTINWKTEIVTETVVYNQDGSVKEQRDTGNDNLLLPHSGSTRHRALEQQQHEPPRSDPPPKPLHWWNRRGSGRRSLHDSNNDNNNNGSDRGSRL